MSESEISFATEVFNHPQSADLSDVAKAMEIAVKCLKEQRRPRVYLDDVYHIIAGHSDYHGDDILAARTCLSEGKEVYNIKPIAKAMTLFRPLLKFLLDMMSEKSLAYRKGKE